MVSNVFGIQKIELTTSVRPRGPRKVDMGLLGFELSQHELAKHSSGRCQKTVIHPACRLVSRQSRGYNNNPNLTPSRCPPSQALLKGYYFI